MLVIVLIPVFGVLIGVMALGGFLAAAVRGSTPLGDSKDDRRPQLVPGPYIPARKSQSQRRSPNRLLNFGSEGIGPGMFKDARSIAIDGSGKIYVGEYIGGRIQVFDPEGNFMTQWTVDPKMPLRGLACRQERHGLRRTTRKDHPVRRRDRKTARRSRLCGWRWFR